MSHRGASSRVLALQILVGLLILCMCSSFSSATVILQGNETDFQALLDFKSRIYPFKILSSWNNSIHHCKWVGITCNTSTGRVVQLSLGQQRLAGTVSPSIGNLTFLRVLNLRFNSFHGEFPNEVGRLLYLQNLSITLNYFTGGIPSNLSYCKELRILFAGSNNLTGNIPTWIGNLSSLSKIGLGVNNFHGSIPKEMGYLSGLTFLGVNGNYLSGTVPPSIYNISSINYITVGQNKLQGSIPTDVGLSLPNLEIFGGAVNNFTGTIPVSLVNASRLQLLDFAQNALTGTLPKNLGVLKSLFWLNFDENRLVSDGKDYDGLSSQITSLVNCTELEFLGLEGNMFGGGLPNLITNLSSRLRKLKLGKNKLYGSIPAAIGHLASLERLGLEGNLLAGSVPDGIGKLKNLGRLNLNGNKFSGTIPWSIGNLTSLILLFMEDNNFEGSIPSSLGNCQKLLVLSLHNNKLSGTIPKQVIAISSLSIYLDVSNNVLTGPIPDDVGNLRSLAELVLSENNFSGVIPSSLGKCVSLERLHLQGNLFKGEIPQSLDGLRGLEDIDLSRNNLSGKIPEFLGELALRHLNLSYNNFEGEVPKVGIFKNATSTSIYGNGKLCGGIPEFNLSACATRKASSRKSLALKVFIPLASTLAFIILFLCFIAYFCVAKRTRKRSEESAITTRELNAKISFSELARGTGGFSQDNLIGLGSFGSVYKGTLGGDGELVAVKVLNLQQRGASRSFIDECKALRGIRHRNLLKIITAVSTLDDQGNDFKALVFEFMSNGNLDDWIHTTTRDNVQGQSKRLTFIQRLNIAIDVACGLEYLHNFCQTPIVHCDVKPNNVLLDDDLVAHVGDFGLATLLYEESNESSPSKQHSVMSGGLKGSIGYIPPEYGMGGQPSTLGDIYSYGILLLEIFTGKRPTSDEFEGGIGIHQYVEMALPNHAMEIIDPFLLPEEENEDEEIYLEKAIRKGNRRRRVMEDCLGSLMQVGVSCSANGPLERLQSMNMVVNKLQAIKKSYVSK